MALLRVVEHFYELLIAVDSDVLWLAHQVLYVHLLFNRENLIDGLVMETFVSDPVN